MSVANRAIESADAAHPGQLPNQRDRDSGHAARPDHEHRAQTGFGRGLEVARRKKDDVRGIGHADDGAANKQRPLRSPGSLRPAEQSRGRHDRQPQTDRDRHPDLRQIELAGQILLRRTEYTLSAQYRGGWTINVPNWYR